MSYKEYIAIFITAFIIFYSLYKGFMLRKRDYPKIDHDIKEYFYENKSPYFTSFMLKSTKLGNIETLIMISIPILFYLLKQEKLISFSAVLNSLMIPILITQLMKIIFRKHRPKERSVNIKEVGYSFPSGHSAVGISFYTTLAYVTGRPLKGFLIILLLGIILGIIIAISRLVIGVHWYSDVLCGSMIGFTCAFWSIYLFNIQFFYKMFEMAKRMSFL